MYIYIYKCIHVYIYMYVYTHIWLDQNIFTHIYIYTWIHTALLTGKNHTSVAEIFTPTNCLFLALSLYLTGSFCWWLCPLGVGMSPILSLQLVSSSILLLHCSIWETMPRARESKNALAVTAALFKLKSWLPGVENARNKTNAGKTASKRAKAEEER